MLTTRKPSSLVGGLTAACYRVFEAASVSEVLYLCENESVDVVVISPEVDDPDVIQAQLRRITITLKPEATVKDLVWELTLLFPSAGMSVQQYPARIF